MSHFSAPRSGIAIALMVSMLPLLPAAADEAPLGRLFRDYETWTLIEFPEKAMAQGDYSNADRIYDTSLAAIERRQAQRIEFRAQLRAIPRTGLTRDELLNFDLFDKLLSDAIEGHQFRAYLMPIGARDGPHQDIPQMNERVRFASTDDFKSYLSRLERTPALIEQTIELMRAGVDAGLVPPRVVMEGVPAQFDKLLADGGLSSLAAPFDAAASRIDAGSATPLRRRFDEKSLSLVRESISKLRRYFNDEYISKCRPGIACRDLPNGEAYYAHQLRIMTTTTLSAKEIHEIGLREVARIRAEMLQVIRKSDYLERHTQSASLNDDELFAVFVQYLRSDPRFYYSKPEELLAGYRDICKQIDAHMPRLFGKLPRLSYGVREIPAFMAPTQTTAYYQQGDIRNAEPGFFYANTYALEQRPKYEMRALAVHEAVPGHHHQVALAQELSDVPDFRRNYWITAFGEGWALYSERLGIEMGLYADPYDDFGRLTYEMWRACRLVVDPGIHALGWSREKAVEFMLANSALSEHNINAEVDRYISWPGQATAYKIGELKIRELRERATKELGAAFDLRDFHDVVLGAGCIPLDILEKRVVAWIAEKKPSP